MIYHRVRRRISVLGLFLLKRASRATLGTYFLNINLTLFFILQLLRACNIPLKSPISRTIPMYKELLIFWNIAESRMSRDLFFLPVQRFMGTRKSFPCMKA